MTIETLYNVTIKRLDGPLDDWTRTVLVHINTDSKTVYQVQDHSSLVKQLQLRRQTPAHIPAHMYDRE